MYTPYVFVCLQREDSLVLFSAMLYECVTQECPEMLPTYIAIEQVTGNIEGSRHYISSTQKVMKTYEKKKWQ